VSAWIEVPEGSPFGPDNLPYGVFRRDGEPRVGVAIGERVIDLLELARARLLDAPAEVFRTPSLNPFMALGPRYWSACWARLRELVADDSNRSAVEPALLALAEAKPLLPIEVADYVDFYSSLEHAANVGRMLRPAADPLPANWRHLPAAYHGRSGTVVVSGTPVPRPSGQRLGPDGPLFGPSAMLDVELELGFVIGTPSRRGEPVPVESALEHVFGVVLLNDWSARDIQAWEYQPLGPFLAKSFATSIGAWVTPLEALMPYRVAGSRQEPPPLDYLRTEPGVFDLSLELRIGPDAVAQTSARHLYWSVEQQIAHLTVNGASLRTGDLLGTGTISGPEKHERGSLLELSWGGTEPIELSDGSSRTFLEDGDEVVLRGSAGPGLGLAEVRGRVSG
jgi:fumarylacetoacetase